jgi:hypothetical protein
MMSLLTRHFAAVGQILFGLLAGSDGHCYGIVYAQPKMVCGWYDQLWRIVKCDRLLALHLQQHSSNSRDSMCSTCTLFIELCSLNINHCVEHDTPLKFYI